MDQPADFADGRFERKYLLPDRVAVAVRDSLLPYLQVDAHTPPNSQRGYAVYSLYFDTPSLEFYRHTRQRVSNRVKLRVRFYSHEPAALAFIEIKEKANNQVFKRRFLTDKIFVEAMLREPNGEAIQHALSNGARGTALEEFCRRRTELGASPKLFVAYDREAYNSISEPMVRVTFDRRISATPCGAAAALNVPRYGSNVGGLNVLLEFKYAGERPQWLADAVTKFGLRRASFPSSPSAWTCWGCQGNSLVV